MFHTNKGAEKFKLVTNDMENPMESKWTDKAKIEKHNRHFFKGLHSYSQKMNQFGDLLSHEFVSIMNGYKSKNTASPESLPVGAKYLMPAN